MSRYQEEIRRLKLNKADTKEKLIEYGNNNTKERDNYNNNFEQKTPTANPSKLLSNKRIKVESREINRNTEDISKTKNQKKILENNNNINTEELKLPDININKNKALTKKKVLEKYQNEDIVAHKENEINKINTFLKDEMNNNKNKQKSKKTISGIKKTHTLNNNNNLDNNYNIEENTNKKNEENLTSLAALNNNNNNTNEKKYRKCSSKLPPKESIKNLNDSLNESNEKDNELEKENNKNLNEISDMMKDILQNN